MKTTILFLLVTFSFSLLASQSCKLEESLTLRGASGDTVCELRSFQTSQLTEEDIRNFLESIETFDFESPKPGFDYLAFLNKLSYACGKKCLRPRCPTENIKVETLAPRSQEKLKRSVYVCLDRVSDT